ncbi:hypothetical protein D3C71_1273740 [compost metagenome]
MSHGDVFQINGADPLTSGLDDILAAVSDLHEAVGIDGRDIACREPAVHQGITTVALEVRGDDPGAANHQFARGFAVTGKFLAILADDLHIDAVHDPALFSLQGAAFGAVHREVPGLGGTNGPERAQLGHAPNMQHLYVVAVLEGRHHGRGAGRAADYRPAHGRECIAGCFDMGKQALPDGGHASGQGDFLCLEQLVERFSIEQWAGEYKLGPDHAGHVRQPPGVDMEHRHHWQDGVTLRAVQGIGEGGGISVQKRRAVTVEHALGVASGTGGVAQRRCAVLIEGWPYEVIDMHFDQIFVAK